MSEKIKPFVPKDNKTLELSGNRYKPQELIDDFIHNPDFTGWHFGAGEPEFWKFAEKLIVPRGKMLDIGIGFGRNAFMFALQKMDVTGYNIDPNAIKVVERIAKAYSLPIHACNADIRTQPFQPETYDTVLINETFVHFPSKDEAFDVTRKAFDATKPGGHVWIRAAGKHDELFKEYQLQSQWEYSGIRKINDDVFKAYCDCSGEIESHLFFDPIEVLNFFTENKMRIVHTQVMPERNRANIMFGEDWKQNRCKGDWRFVTVLAQKAESPKNTT